MLPLPTEATIEAMNYSTGGRHLFHTYNGRNWFRQFGFTQQNIKVDMEDMERDMEIWNGKGSRRHWCPGYSQCFSSDFDILIEFPYTAAQANLLVCELFFIVRHYSDKLLSGCNYTVPAYDITLLRKYVWTWFTSKLAVSWLSPKKFWLWGVCTNVCVCVHVCMLGVSCCFCLVV